MYKECEVSEKKDVYGASGIESERSGFFRVGKLGYMVLLLTILPCFFL